MPAPIATRRRSRRRALLALHVQRFTLALSRNAFTHPRRARRPARRRRSGRRSARARSRRLDRRPARRAASRSTATTPIPRCLSPGFVAAGRARPQGQTGRAVIIAPAATCSRSSSTTPDGAVEGVAEYRRETLARAGRPAAAAGRFRARAGPGRAGDAAAPARSGRRPRETVSRRSPSPTASMRLRIRSSARRRSAPARSWSSCCRC